MELSYIWVEKFRNIERQGFNLSSKHFFEYNSENHNLTIVKNENFIENLFDNNISNITGLIGQNATGKTNLLELITYLMDGANTKIARPFFVILTSETNKFLGYFFETPIPYHSGIDFKPYKSGIENFDTIFFSNVFDGRKHDFDKNTKDLSTNNLLSSKFGENFYTNYSKDIQRQIRFINSPQFKLLENVESEIYPQSANQFAPTHVRLTGPSWGNIFARAKSFDVSNAEITKEGGFIRLEAFCREMRKKIIAVKYPKEDNKLIIVYTAFLVYIDFLINEFGEKDIKEDFLDTKKIKREIAGYLFKEEEKHSLSEIHDIIVDKISLEIDSNNPYGFERVTFLKELTVTNFKDTIVEEQGKNASRRVEFKIPYSKEIGSFLRRYLDAVTNQNLSYSIEWDGISSGHKAYIGLFSRFNDFWQKRRSKNGNILVCIDEGDLYFHPKWQTEFLYKLIKILPQLFEGVTIQIILTTHSPFLVSDLPKSNLLFLRKDSDGLTSVIPNNEIEGETFGGNIGELFIRAFFMGGSLISHFAASKIKELIGKANGKIEFSPTDEILFSQIGENMIKNYIKSRRQND